MGAGPTPRPQGPPEGPALPLPHGQAAVLAAPLPRELLTRGSTFCSVSLRYSWLMGCASVRESRLELDERARAGA